MASRNFLNYDINTFSFLDSYTQDNYSSCFIVKSLYQTRTFYIHISYNSFNIIYTGETRYPVV